jgi:hypothetical protein
MSRRNRRGEVNLKTVGCVGVIAGLLCCGGSFGGGWTGLQVYFRGHELTGSVLSAIDESPDAQMALGRPVAPGWTVVGSMSTSGEGTGNADLSIPVSGSLGAGRVRVVAVREGAEWRPVVMRLRTDDADVDLLAAARVAAVDARSEDVGAVMEEMEGAAGKGLFGEAMALCEQALDMEKDDAHIWSRCGSVALDAGDLGRAERRLKRALAMNPEDDRARYDLAQVYAQTGRTEACVEAFTEIIRADPSNGDAWYQRSACFAAQGDKRKARAGAREACSLGSSEGCALADRLD